MTTKNIENQPNDFEKVIPTAWMVAYRRTFSDIPFSQDIFAKLEALRERKDQKEIPADLKRPELAPQFEARHKLIDKLILQTGFDQVLELAAGFSSRGLSMSKDNNFNYVEVDLPSVISEKEQIIKEIAEDHNFPIPNNLHFAPANVLNFAELEEATSHFDKTKPLAIINEGLLRYLTLEEKAQVGKNIHRLLEKYGGAWITSDISLRKIFSQENTIMAGYVEKISELTGKDIVGNRFETEREAQDFFENLGYSIERHSFMEVLGDLVSPNNLKLSETQVESVLEDAVVFVMRCR
ncbi:MAG TPA: class I SAM-dependent methyltransferase [bacterium]|nr:class I SAM-dependent methyltransferase [bacterium]